MRCLAVFGVLFTASIRRQDSRRKDEEREVRTVRTLKSYSGGAGDVQKRRFARIEIQWRDWTTTTGRSGVVR